MTSKLDNLIDFCFISHSMEIIGFSPSYLMEKWTKYIGIVPNGDDIVGDYPRLKEVVDEWSNRWEFDNQVNDYGIDNSYIHKIVYFILIINSNPFTFINVGQDRDDPNWKLADIINIFEKYIGRISDITDRYINIHPILKLEKEKWLSKPINIQHSREYSLDEIFK